MQQINKNIYKKKIARITGYLFEHTYENQINNYFLFGWVTYLYVTTSAPS
jgi:hypothetical protein